MSAAPDAVECRVYRASRQAELYVYLRDCVQAADLPAALVARTGELVEVMPLRLHAGRPLARVDVQAVMAALAQNGWFVQMPPGAMVNAHLHFGD